MKYNIGVFFCLIIGTVSNSNMEYQVIKKTIFYCRYLICIQLITGM